MDYLVKEIPTEGLPVNLFRVEFIIVTDSNKEHVDNHLGHTLAELNYGDMNCILFKPMGTSDPECTNCQFHEADLALLRERATTLGMALGDLEDENKLLRDQLAKSLETIVTIDDSWGDVKEARSTLSTLKYYRKNAMLKQVEMGELLGISSSTVSRIECGFWNALTKKRLVEVAGMFAALQEG